MDEVRSIIDGTKVFPSYPEALLMVGLEGVDVVLLAFEGAAETCPLLICHCKRMTGMLRRKGTKCTEAAFRNGRVNYSAGS